MWLVPLFIPWVDSRRDRKSTRRSLHAESHETAYKYGVWLPFY